jgi:DNA-binding NarL/FixJ family response regulator
MNDPGGLATSIFGLGDTAQGDYAAASAYFHQALKIAADIHWTPLILEILTGISDLLLQTDEGEQAVELLTLVTQHAAAEPPTQHRAELLLARAKTILSSTVFDAASARGKTADLDAVARAVSDQLKLPKKYAPSPLSANQGLVDPLSERELEILRLLAQGLTNQQIAEALTLVVGTVKAHNHHIFSKLVVSNRVQAIARARELGLL